MKRSVSVRGLNNLAPVSLDNEETIILSGMSLIVSNRFYSFQEDILPIRRHYMYKKRFDEDTGKLIDTYIIEGRCAECKVAFNRAYSKQRFCSPNCRLISWRRDKRTKDYKPSKIKKDVKDARPVSPPVASGDGN